MTYTVHDYSSSFVPDPISNGPQIHGLIKYGIVLSDLAYRIEHLKVYCGIHYHLLYISI